MAESIKIRRAKEKDLFYSIWNSSNKFKYGDIVRIVNTDNDCFNSADTIGKKVIIRGIRKDGFIWGRTYRGHLVANGIQNIERRYFNNTTDFDMGWYYVEFCQTIKMKYYNKNFTHSSEYPLIGLKKPIYHWVRESMLEDAVKQLTFDF